MSDSPVLSVRINARERALLEQAAARARTTLSEFARQRLVQAAELELMLNRPVLIPASDWERFEAWAREPARAVPALARLAKTAPSWET